MARNDIARNRNGEDCQNSESAQHAIWPLPAYGPARRWMRTATPTMYRRDLASDINTAQWNILTPRRPRSCG
jgi:hypothetical protein